MYRDEELRSIGVLARVGHGEPASSVVLQLEVLIGEPEENKCNDSSLNEKSLVLNLTFLHRLSGPQCHHHV